MMRDLWAASPLQDVERAFPVLQRLPTAGYVPSFDVCEHENEYLIEADLPGVKQEDLDVSVSGNQLTVSGSRQAEEHKEGENYHVYERQYGDFARTFTLPEGIDSDRIEAKLGGGVLSVTLPKRAESKPRKIPLGERIKEKLGK
jgi:HSP20 family protein